MGELHMFKQVKYLGLCIIYTLIIALILVNKETENYAQYVTGKGVSDASILCSYINYNT